MSERKYKFKSVVCLYPGMAGWHFIYLPKKESREIKERFGKNARGWGSLPVMVNVGKTSWKTSIFPDKKSETYLLPLKKEVRVKEGMFDKDIKVFTLQIRA
ncbi:MAG: DUF1905 domain-containing protein [Patescibacteria group bacterium]